jgi:hypothetical protein
MEREIDHVSIKNAEELINAIVVRAVDDYRTSKRKLKELEEKGYTNELTEREIKRRNEYERLLSDSQRFFHSEWFFALTEASGEKILQALEGENEN